MGNLFTRNSWRAPLQLIDCWLPTPDNSPPQERPAARVIQLFTRAGWLQAERPVRPDHAAPSATVHPFRHPRMRPRSQLAPAVVATRRILDSSNTRVVISGRMADVCAELDRLVALESQEAVRAA